MKLCLLRLYLLVSALLLAVMSTGCTTVVFSAARLAKEDRTTANQLLDTQIGASLVSGLAEKDANLLIDVNVDVWEARVLLTGTVADSKARQDVAQLARADKRVKRVYDEIQVVSGADQVRRREAQKNKTPPEPERKDPLGTDFWVETKISAQLVASADVSSVNYRWRCVRRTAYLIGRASSRAELRTVMDIVSATAGVERVKSFVEIRP